MSKAETAVRDAAHALHVAITNAKASGIVVTWPRNFEGLAAIEISETSQSSKAHGSDKPTSKVVSKPKG